METEQIKLPEPTLTRDERALFDEIATALAGKKPPKFAKKCLKKLQERFLRLRAGNDSLAANYRHAVELVRPPDDQIKVLEKYGELLNKQISELNKENRQTKDTVKVLQGHLELERQRVKLLTEVIVATARGYQ